MREIESDILPLQTSQLNALKETVLYTYANSSFYKRTFNSILTDGTKPFNLELYRSLPFTSKEDLAAHNEDFLCVPKNKIAEYVTTSGTTGAPISLFLTKNDLDRLARNERDSLALMGNDENDLFQLLTTIDRQFMAGLAYYLGVQKLNAGMIRIGPGVPQLQWNSILQNQPSTLIAVPSYIIALIEFAKENKIDFKNSSVRSIVCIGEPIRSDKLELNTLGRRITDDWKVELYSTYASTEMGAAFSECTEQKGCHLNDELLFLEVLKEDGTEAHDGESGEIVVTTLGVEGTPLVRYRTGDIATIHLSDCNCGKKTPRLGPIIGRKHQMIKFKGTTIYPKAIFEILEQFSEISCYKVLVDKDDLNNDSITIILEDKIQNAPLFEIIQEQCKSKIRVLPNFEFMNSKALSEIVYQKNLRKPEKIKFN